MATQEEGKIATLHKERFSNRLPTKVEINNADQLRHIIASQVTEGQSVNLSLAVDGGETRNITLVPALTDTLLEILRLISSGRSFRMIPVEAELTTQEAADMLNVSRPFLVKLLEAGRIPFTTVGRHRRVQAEDLFAYRVARNQARSDALSELAVMDAAGGLI